MKSTGIVRKVDELGRIVIPKELRNTFEIQERDPLEIFVDNEKIVLKKYSPYKACLITGEVSDQNFRLADGKIVLSPAAAEQLLNDLKEMLNIE
ncbi:AbrB family transcriptional regulator [Bacillus canaveralius]|uniref:AbrB family transcriptional regulator n=1 Tax=Bacillus canaveralius TaxID=1403243 RepID=A0A2N5GIS8_9BACI|nr:MULTISPECIES: AbrB/MazE/SpoVT family DNA-binding domain-containing protein [Bacillus]PLR80930.1 AbrB family transcriptional regulator [Bacillus canaveralius]PLR81692.1 AbrB family transcriptional regulator [Bacillus sp. V33-4]PLR91218.1 AbrB family transcriptional regulator [Bacillus canaveralius]RSK52682.1 AbrB/MazE/SpoVT family DNA-binding domain-containing protein [Bacillus canaveralius]